MIGRGDDGDWWGVWRNEEANLFIRANYGSDPARFEFSMTKLSVRS
ncbi:MAG: hypothetical protein ABIQ30_01675 [Devosia sp.]